MDELTYELIVLIKDGSPVIWALLMRQVYVEVASHLIWAAIMGVSCFVSLRVGSYCRKRGEDDYASDWEMGTVIAYILAAIAGIVSPVLINGAIMRLINPEFYAIQFVLQGLGQ